MIAKAYGLWPLFCFKAKVSGRLSRNGNPWYFLKRIEVIMITAGTSTTGEKPSKVWLPVRVSTAWVVHEYPLRLGLHNTWGGKVSVTTNNNIDLQKYTQILDANLRPFCCRRFRGKTFVFKDDMHRHAVDNFPWKLTMKNSISGTTWPARSPD